MVSCGARLAPFDIAELREVTAYDELELDTLGDEKTALFLIMSDTDDSFTEELKACDPMSWVGLMNNCMARVEEIIFADLIFC